MNPDLVLIEGFIREQTQLSPVIRQVYLNRLGHTPTEAEIAYARDQVAGRTSTNA